MRIAALTLGLVIAAGACASSGTAAGDQAATAATTRPRTNVISLQEIRESSAPTLEVLIRQARPGWNAGRDPTRPIVIVVNNDVFGPYDSLKQLSVASTSEVRYLTKSEAQMKWGPRVQEVIQVITR